LSDFRLHAGEVHGGRLIARAGTITAGGIDASLGRSLR